MPPKTHFGASLTSTPSHTPPQASDRPATDGDVSSCSSQSNASAPCATPPPSRDARDKSLRTSHCATTAPQTHCPGSGPCRPCSPWHPPPPAATYSTPK